MEARGKQKAKRILAAVLAAFYSAWAAPLAQGYSFNEIVPDVRQPVAITCNPPAMAHRQSVVKRR